ncbi:MAG: 2-isopropylmalate synthase [Clostridium sp.]|jgi:2-isopropylmalate synthase|uniref:2-isopropylmalate synthase n=1 Tax=Clostridium sp. TaxID=1506 RepID=UPI0025C5047E|nr:2-isopropylmalate synthase [Clostridium sp.]MCH3964929.1 2-isopropylmalate synthase [Clostridium sp.]MCI1716577.1 2-isopropylmalate synthase [Clostridium sp.]MCI1800941.1 2-isopropylmalate synthase [Clostridium sp.]MCI1814754.1 2-isopropylmalate synthase [Clostridium sp.]MCI1871688.1 2-isopropylmalate synthase [Clostridium sp.]
MENNKVYIFDTTMRDGEQTPRVNLNIKDKIEIAKQLEKMNVDIIEAGFPIASEGDFEAVRAVAKAVKRPVVVALSRAAKKDIDRAWEAVKYADKPRIHTFIATSDVHMEYKLKMTPDEVYKRAVDMVRYAKSICPSVEFSPEDATRTEPEFLYRIVEGVIDAGADIVNIPDTVGYDIPEEFGNFIKGIKENVPNIDRAIISVHCHDDLGMAVANSMAAVKNGARQVECAVNGIGERAGNASLEEVVMAIKTREKYFGCRTDIVTEEIVKTSKLISHATGMPIPNNKAIVGANAFAHEAGIHQHGVLACRSTYEIMTPESVGLKKSTLVIGKHSGRHGFVQHLKELGYDNLSEDKINEAFKQFKDLTGKKKTVSDEDIETIINHEIFQVPEAYNLKYFQFSSGNTMVSTSTVEIEFKGKNIREAACGDGPVDAAFKAIEKASGMDIKLKDYFIRSIGSGKDAVGEVTVKVENNNRVFTAKGMSTDIVEASAKAFVNAVNKIYYEIENNSSKYKIERV